VTARLPADVFAQLAAADPEDIPGQVPTAWGLLTPYHEKAGYTAPRLERDLAYGTHPRQRLVVHAPAHPGRAAPAVLFVHGGGFTAGDKHVPGTPMYDHAGAWAVRHGAVGVTMTYRLAPDHPWPAGAQDVAAAVGWIRGNIGRYGGDPERIVVTAHSAGASHLASFLAGQGGGSLDGIRLLFSVAERDTRYFHAQAAVGRRPQPHLRDRRPRRRRRRAQHSALPVHRPGH
jgi:triacylglycerol lipase